MVERGKAPYLALRLERTGLDGDSLAQLTRSLQRAIDNGNLPTEAFEQSEGESTPGAKGDPFTLGVLALAVAPAIVEQVIGIVRDWGNRPGAKPVKVSVKEADNELTIEYDASKMTVQEIQKIITTLNSVL